MVGPLEALQVLHVAQGAHARAGREQKVVEAQPAVGGAVARALRAILAVSRKCVFSHFFPYGRAGARFPRAQPRARPWGARQSILLSMEMCFDYLIAFIALKLAENDEIRF